MFFLFVNQGCKHLCLKMPRRWPHHCSVGQYDGSIDEVDATGVPLQLVVKTEHGVLTKVVVNLRFWRLRGTVVPAAPIARRTRSSSIHHHRHYRHHRHHQPKKNCMAPNNN